MPKKGNILIGISGGIAAYKTLSLIRLFVKNNYNVKVIATKNTLHFITKLSIETLSQNTLYSDTFDTPSEYHSQHISLSDEADILIVAPATANIIGKFAHGIADDALSTTLLAFNKPIFIAPAMNYKMLNNFAVKKNIDYLQNNGINFINSQKGDLACGYKENGRMEEPQAIFDEVLKYLNKKKSFANKNILITAGPTFEPIDPVRYIGNHSSGKMGVAIANEFQNRGANVTIICGPIDTKNIHKDIKIINILTSEEMFNSAIDEFENKDIIISAAAVADYKPTVFSNSKIKKNDNNFELSLTKTKDILFELGKKKSNTQILIGFALENENEIENATKKIYNKNLDFIVLNSLNNKGAGFKNDTNQISIIDKNKNIINFDLKSKQNVAIDIINYIENNKFNI